MASSGSDECTGVNSWFVSQTGPQPSPPASVCAEHSALAPVKAAVALCTHASERDSQFRTQAKMQNRLFHGKARYDSAVKSHSTRRI
jgi:hypothetical protein